MCRVMDDPCVLLREYRWLHVFLRPIKPQEAGRVIGRRRMELISLLT